MAGLLDSGTHSATGGGADVVYSSTLPRIFLFAIDLSNMVALDSVTIRIETVVRNGGTRRVVYEQQFSGLQASPFIINVSRPVPSPFEVRLTIDQTAGTNRDYDWFAMSLGSLVVEATGTITTDGTAQVIATISKTATFILITDSQPMIQGDVVRLTVTMRVLASGANAAVWSALLQGVRSDPDIIQISIPLPSPSVFEAAIERLGGGDRTHEFTIVSTVA